jgi:hypothetical protein
MAWSFSGRSEVIEDPGIAQSGRRCARARFDDGVAQSTTIEGGAAYRISGWIRRVDRGGTEVPKIKVYFLDADGNRADVQAAPFENVKADRWRRWETVVQAPLNAKTLNLTLRGFFGGSEWFYYDDLAVERIEAISWPAWDATPNLHGLTVTVPDIADVWTEALLRIPPASLVPVDGQLDSSVLTRGQDIRVENGHLSVTFDVPDVVYAGGEPIWLTLRPRNDTTLDPARSRVVLNVLEPRQAYAEYPPQLERLIRRMYSDASEAHAYDGRDWSQMTLGRYVRRVLDIDPENKPATYVYRRIAKVRENVQLERPGPADAPEWAVWAREALRNRHEIISWWLDNRQHSNGELAGHINDDGEFSCNWPSHYLMTGDQRIADGLRKLADVAWEMSAGTGYTVGSRDVEHAAEDQSCTQPQVLLVDYGNPKAVERLMVMSRYLDFWTAINEVGRRQFKSYMFTTKQIWDDPPFDVDHPYCPLAMVGTGHLVWYTESPKVADIFREEAESWALACLSTAGGKAEGEIPKEIRFRDSQVNPYSPYPTNPILQKRNTLYRGGAGAYIVRYFMHGAHTLTGDDLFGRVLELRTPSEEQKIQQAQAMLERFNDPVASREGAWSPSQNETTLYAAWQATGDRTWLVEELKEVVRQQIRNRWLLTEAEPYTDRIPVPGRELLCRMFLGDWTSGKSHVPGHWVSWEGGGLDYAALILDAKPDRLKAIVYSFHEKERPMTMRVWRLPHGRYEVSTGVDRDGDDQPEERLCRREMELWRYDGTVVFTVFPGQTQVIELSLLEELDNVRTRPDLAIGPYDVAIEDGAAVATVHNIGGSTAPPSTIEVRGANNKVIGVAQTPPLEAPHSLQPITARVRIQLDSGARPARAVLDPADRIAEITESNNQLRLPAK